MVLLTSCGDPVEQPQVSDSTRSDSRIAHMKNEPIVRVRLADVDSASDTIELGTSGQRIEVWTSKTTRDLTGPVRIERTGDGWTVHETTRSHSWTGDQLEVSSTTPLLLDREGTSRHYAGVLHCVSTGNNGKLEWNLIEHIGLERYLPGVLVAELYAGWTFECYAAQCVAARSFACMRIAQRTHHQFDVTDGPSTQAYHGVVDDETAHTAQSETSGIVLSWNDHLVPGYFSSCCGGRAATAVDAIGPSPVNDIPPLMGHTNDDYCVNAPLFDWTIDRSARTLGRRLSRYGRMVGNTDLESMTTVSEIQIAHENIHGRPVKLKIIDRNKHHAILTTDMFFRAANHSGSLGRPAKELWSGWSVGTTERGRIDLQGHGFGHGAGLCQYGAQAMGKQGHSWRQIIKWYFPDVTLHRAW